MALPQYSGPDDALAVVRYLKTKSTGSTLKDMTAALGATTTDSRKIGALEYWGIIERAGDKLKLTNPLGRDLGRDGAAGLASAMQAVLSSVRAYRMAVEWAHHQSFSEIDVKELGAYWHDHHSSDLGTESEKAITAACSTFMRLAEAGGLGTFVVGRRGASTRLTLNREAVAIFVEQGPDPDPDPGAGSSDGNGDDEVLEDTGSGTADAGFRDRGPTPTGNDALRVFITHGKNMELVDQVKTMLDLADVPYEIAVEEETAAIPVPDKVLAAMRRCNAGVMIVSVDEAGGENQKVNDNVLIEIGSAFVLYDKKVVLVWDRRLSVPSNLQGLYRCEFEGDELSWATGMKLMKTINGFKADG